MRRHGIDQYSGLETVNPLHSWVKAGLELNPDRTPDDLMLRSNQVVIDPDDRVGGHGEANSLITGGLSQDRGIYPNDLVGHVDQRSTRIARVDGRVGLDEVLELAGSALFDGAVPGRDDACGNRLGKRKRAADGNHPVAHLAGVRIAHLHRGQRLGGGNLHHRQIGILIYANYLAHAPLKAFRVGGKLHINAIRLLHHVIVSNDVAAGIHDEAGAERLTHLVTLFATARSLSTKEAVEEILKVLVRTLAAAAVLVAILVVVTTARGDGGRRMRTPPAGMGIFLRQGLGIDVHHCRGDVLGDLGESRRQGDRVGNLQRGGVRAIGLRFIPANTVDSNRSNQYAG